MSTTGGKIALGDKEYSFKPLTLRQVREISRLVGKPLPMEGGEMEAELIDRAVNIIVLGVGNADEKLTADDILEMPITGKDIDEASRVILEASGFARKKEPETGEAEPAATPA